MYLATKKRYLLFTVFGIWVWTNDCLTAFILFIMFWGTKGSLFLRAKENKKSCNFIWVTYHILFVLQSDFHVFIVCQFYGFAGFGFVKWEVVHDHIVKIKLWVICQIGPEIKHKSIAHSTDNFLFFSAQQHVLTIANLFYLFNWALWNGDMGINLYFEQVK